MKIEAVIFDFFGVVVSEVGHPWFEKHAPGKMDSLKSTYFRQQDTGEISGDELFEKLATLNNTTAKEVRDEWLQNAGLNPQMLTFIENLKASHQTAICSNAASSFIRALLTQYDLTKLFDEIVISSEVKYAKPDREIFDITLGRLNVAPENTLFIDDSPRNTEAASALGIHAILFENMEDFMRDVEAYL